MTNGSMPTKDQLHNPVLDALKSGGGSATNGELFDYIVENLNLPDGVVEQKTPSGQPRLWKRIGWARNELKHSGYVEQTGTGIWAVTVLGASTTSVDSRRVRSEAVRIVQGQPGDQARSTDPEASEEDFVDAILDENDSWRGEIGRILHGMSPGAFERLCGVILRESGFTEVKVTGKSSDGGIDGNGIIRIEGLISFPILFQCKRWEGSVGPSVVRDFRGAMQGRADRGLIIATGTFSSEARREASRDGAPPIDLVDGESLVDRLKQLRLGVKVEMVEQITVETNWWESNFGNAV